MSRRRGSLLQLREHLVAVELRHQDVEQQQVEALPAQQVERLAAVLGEDDRVPLLLQTAAEQEPVHRLSSAIRIVPGEGGGAHGAGFGRSAASACSSAPYSRSIRSTSSAAPSTSPFFARSSSVPAELGEVVGT